MKQIPRKQNKPNKFNAICRALKPYGTLTYSKVNFYLLKQIKCTT